MIFRNILSSFASRVITSFFTFTVVLIASRALGPERYGTIGLIMVSVQFTILFSSLIGGTSLVYYASKLNLSTLFIISILWALIVSFALTITLSYFELYPSDYFLWALAIAFFSVGALNNMYLLVGLENILIQNLLHVFQVGIHVVMIISFFHFFKYQTVEFYLLSVLISQFLCFLLGTWFLRKYIFPLRLTQILKSIKLLSSYGFWIQLGAMIQLINYRLNFYLVDFFVGRTALGVFTLAVQLCEALWILPRSFALVQFSRISNQKDSDSSIFLTSALFHLTMLIILVTSIVIFIIPESMFLFVFGQGFAGLKYIMNILLIGVVCFSGVIIIAHHFSGINKVWLNVIISTFSLLILILFSLLLIPNFQLAGAAWANSCMYLFSLLLSIFLYKKIFRQNILSPIIILKNWLKIIELLKKNLHLLRN